MKIDIMTLFPEMFDNVLSESIIGRAREKGIIDIKCHQIRDYTENKQKQVDDYPYGGGWGCVMMAQPLKSCLDDILSENNGRKTRVIYLSPQGKTFDQSEARRLKNEYDHLILVCGHYEGIDERFIEKCVDEELSIGDYVLTGGEIAAMAVTDAVCRMVPGVLSDEECYTGESHWDGLLEYPQYTRPESWEGLAVPPVLLEGDHSKIEQWRHTQQLRRTRDKRPDMFEKLKLSDEETKLVGKPELDVSFRKAELSDMDDILSIVTDAKALLKSHGIDQWQGEYPEKTDFEKDISNGWLYIIKNRDETAAIFSLVSDKIPEYEAISDGKWYSSSMDYVSIHRLAVSQKYRSSGISAYILRYSEQLARQMGVRSVRVDTHKKNKGCQNLLRDGGYKYRGNIYIDCEPGHDTLRYAFEKVLKK